MLNTLGESEAHLQLSHVQPEVNGNTSIFLRASNLDLGKLGVIYCEMKMKNVQSFVLYVVICLFRAASPFKCQSCSTEVSSLATCPARAQPFHFYIYTSSPVLNFKMFFLNSKNNWLFRDCPDTMLIFKMCFSQNQQESGPRKNSLWGFAYSQK